MKNVTLSLNDEDGNLIEKISTSFADKDVALFNSYLIFLARVRGCTILKRGFSAASMTFNDKTGLEFTCPEYSDSEIYELLHLLRPLILDDEVSSFKKISGLIGKGFVSKNLRSYLKDIRRTFDDGEMSFMMQIQIGEQKLFHQSLLYKWLNGTQYHTDIDKAEDWQELEKSLTTEGARALVIGQLYSKIKALFELEYIVRLILEDKV